MTFEKRNSAWLSAQFIISILFSFINIKLNLLSFGNEVFGIWIVILSVWGFGTAIDFGFATSIIKYVAETSSDDKKLENVLSSVLLIYIVMGGILLSIGMFIGFNYYLNNSALIASRFFSICKSTFILLGLSFIFQYYGLFFKSIIEGKENFVYTSKVIIIQQTTIFTGVVLIFFTSRSIINLSFVYLFSSIISFISYYGYVRIKLKQYSFNITKFSFNKAKELISFSVAVQAMTLFNALIDPTVKYLLGVYYSVNSVPGYEIARRFAISISGLFFSAYKVILPKVSGLLDSNSKMEFIEKDLVVYCKKGVMFSIIFFGILIFPISMIMLWFYRIPEALIIFIILSLPEAINIFGYSIYNYLLGVGKVKVLSFIQINNYVMTSILLWIGFVLTNTIYGLLGYFFTVIFANYLLLLSIRKIGRISIQRFLVYIEFKNLIYVILSLIIVLITTFFVPQRILLLLFAISLVNSIIFRNHIKSVFIEVKCSLNNLLKFQGVN